MKAIEILQQHPTHLVDFRGNRSKIISVRETNLGEIEITFKEEGKDRLETMKCRPEMELSVSN